MKTNETITQKMLLKSETTNKKLVVGMAISILREDIPLRTKNPSTRSYYEARLDNLSYPLSEDSLCYFDLGYYQSLLSVVTSFRDGYMRLDPLVYGISTDHIERQVLYAEVESSLKSFANELQ